MKHFNLSNRREEQPQPHSRRALFLLVWLVVALMLPNVVLAFTEGYNGWSVAAGLTLPLGLYLLTMSLTRRVSLVGVVLMPVLALCMVQLVLLYLYGGSIIAVDMFTNIMTTNTAESRELLGGMVPIIVVVLALYLPLFYALFRQLGSRHYAISGVAQKVAILVGGVLTIAGVQLLCVANYTSEARIVRDELFPVNVMHNLRLAVENGRAVRQFSERTEGFSYEAERVDCVAGREVYVYVIGESSRAANWSLYGYERVTNPRLGSRDDLCLFKNVVTRSNTTHKSVPIMLSPMGVDEFSEIFSHKGIAALFGEAGFRTCFISAQSPQGAMVDKLAAECDKVIYVDPRSHDERLVQQLKAEIVADMDSDLLFVLHCYGSHYCYNHRYPGEFALFQPDAQVKVDAENVRSLRNAYDNSILYTDYLLNQIIEFLESLDLCSAMLYCSDHGEGLFDDARGHFLHASPEVNYYQLHVPALVWFSERYRSAFPEKVALAHRHRWSPATTSAMPCTLVDIAGIHTRYLDNRYSLVDARFDGALPRLYVDDRNESVAFDEGVGISDLDRREFWLRGIEL